MYRSTPIIDPTCYPDMSPASAVEAPPGLSLDPRSRLTPMHHGYSDPGSIGLLTPSGRRHDLPEIVRDFVKSPHSIDKDELRTILNQFEKTQLVEMLCNASLLSDEVKESVSGLVSTSTTFRRLLVRNIPFQSTSESVKSMLASLFGPVEEGAVVYDRNTGRSKGFAFVTFEDVLAACNAVCSSHREELSIDSRLVYLKFAADRLDHDAQPPTPSPSSAMVKLFVYNLAPHTTSESLRMVFGQYGELEECAVVFDQQGRSKRFAFVTFFREADAWRCLQEPNRTIDGRMTFTHLACEGRNKPTGSTTPTPRAMPTPRTDKPSPSSDSFTHVFTPPADSSGVLAGEEFIAQWLTELSVTSDAENFLASAFSGESRLP